MSEIFPDQAPILNISGGEATIILRRPGRHNAIAPEDCEVISSHLDTIERAPDVRVLVITGTGKKTFSSGYNLDAIRNQLDRRFEDMLNRIEGFSLPTICLLNGSVYGGATDLALCCDFRIGVQGMRLVMPASRFGLHYYPDGIRRYVSILGLGAAKKLFLTGQAVQDAELLRIGFLTELVCADELEAMLSRYVEHVEACAPSVLKTMKMDLLAESRGQAQPDVLHHHFTDSLKSEELALRLEARRKT